MWLSLRLKNQWLRKNDYNCWMHTTSGDFTVSSGYWLVNKINNEELIRKADMMPSLNIIKGQVWDLETSQKIKLFIWRVLSGAVSVVDNLAHRGLKLDLRCQFCGAEIESINHVLFTCPIARQSWALSNFPNPKNGFDHESLFSNFHYLFTVGKMNHIPKEIRQSFPWILWYPWKNRNSFCFEGKFFVASDTILKIREEASQWFLAQTIETISEGNNNPLTFKEDVKWKRPPAPWLKCNIGMSWSKRNSLGSFS